MLVSHRKHFIFIKTVKTAGTSVESYFEKYCMPDKEWRESHAREEYISEAGIIGYRGPNHRRVTWYNHMSAEKISKLLGQDIWKHYYKFTVIRNPFDKLISYFYFTHHDHPLVKINDSTVIEYFRSWIKGGNAIIDDRNQYLINGRECVDFFIRFEKLHEGIEYVCRQISIPFEPSH